MTTETPRAKRSSAWTAFQMCAAIIVVLVVGGSIAWTIRERATAGRIPEGLGQAVLPDGSILVMQAVLFGKSETYSTKVPAAKLWDRILDQNFQEFKVLSAANYREVRFAFSQHDPRTGAALDLTCFDHLEVTDSLGNRLRNEPQQLTVHTKAGAENGTEIPKAAPPVPWKHGFRVLTCHTYRFSMDGPATVKVFDRKGNTIATFPLTIPERERMWQPEPTPELNVWRNGQEVVHLRKVLVKSTRSSVSQREAPHWDYLAVTWDVTVNGQPVPKSNYTETNFYMEDSWGNMGYVGYFFPFREPYWVARLTLTRKAGAAFASAERSPLGTISLVDAGQGGVVQVSSNPLVKSVRLVAPGKNEISVPNSDFADQYTAQSMGGYRIFSSGGSGRISDFGLNTGMSLRRQPIDGGSDGLDVLSLTATGSGETAGVTSQIEFQRSSSMGSTKLSIDSSHPLIVLTTSEVSSNSRILLVAEDDQGRIVPIFPLQHPYQRMPLYAVNPFPDSKSLVLSTAHDSPRDVHLAFKAPDHELPENGQFIYEFEPDGDGWKLVKTTLGTEGQP